MVTADKFVAFLHLEATFPCYLSLTLCTPLYSWVVQLSTAQLHHQDVFRLPRNLPQVNGQRPRRPSRRALQTRVRPHLPIPSHPHLTHPSLNESDRQKLQSAASTVSTYATIGSVVGLGLGVFLAYRLRANRTAMFQAFKAAEKPTEVRFANGRSGASSKTI